jgi:hypothetical protein
LVSGVDVFSVVDVFQEFKELVSSWLPVDDQGATEIG